jgi:hypothetical protein
MKIIAQSTVPTSMPYVHLGYTAATITRPDGVLLVTGLLLMLAGAAVFGSWLAGRIFPRLAFLGRRPLLMLAGGTVLLFCGIVGGGLAFRHSREVPVYPNGWTWMNAEMILQEIGKMKEAGQPIPTELTEDQFGTRVQDAWGHPMRLQVSGEAGAEKYSIISAGPDGTFGTDDDITHPKQPR